MPSDLGKTLKIVSYADLNPNLKLRDSGAEFIAFAKAAFAKAAFAKAAFAKAASRLSF
jgi:hypothetical protein